jgi:glucose/arabinose dehydrogenase
MATLRGQLLRRFVIDPTHPDQVTAQETLAPQFGRLRDAESGADGCLYLLTSNRDGRGSPQAGDDKVLRLCPIS